MTDKEFADAVFAEAVRHVDRLIEREGDPAIRRALVRDRRWIAGKILDASIIATLRRRLAELESERCPGPARASKEGLH